MEIIYEKYDVETGAYLYEASIFEEGQQPEGFTLVSKGNFIKAFLDVENGVAYEGATVQEVSEINTPAYMLQLQNIVSDLRIRAKGAAIGKSGSNAYIVSQVEFYEIKYQQCINPNNLQEVEDLLLNEAEEFGITLAQFKVLVISMYEDAREKYNLFMRMIERCRTKIQTLIENNNWENVDTAFVLVSSLNNVNQARDIMNEILAL